MKKCIVCNSIQYKIFNYRGFKYYKCRNCGLVTTLPIPDLKKINKHYLDKFKKGNYNLLNSNVENYNKVYESIISPLLSIFPKKRKPFLGKRALDIGCFTGDLLILMKKLGANVYGLELQKDAVKIANKKLPKSIFQADVMSKQFNLGKFDIIAMTGLVEHVADPVKLLKKTHKITNKDGLVIIQTPNSSSLFAKILGKYWPPYSPVEHIHLFSRKSLELALSETGFTPIVYKNHLKPLSIAYVYQNLENFGPEFYRIAKPFSKILLNLNITLPFYIGEMIVIAKKK